MSLTDDAAQRQRWMAKAQQTIAALEDLRRALTATVRARPLLWIVESDMHLAVAQTEIEEAITRVQRQH